MSEPLQGLVKLRIDEVRPSPNNPRDGLDGIEDLAQSIAQVGLIQPVVVQLIPATPTRPSYFQLVAGHRRFAAVKYLGRRDIAAIVRREMRPDDELMMMIVENGQRAGLDPIEEARAFKALEASGHTHDQIAKKIGRSQNYVSNRLILLTLPAEEQEALRAKLITTTAATEKARVDAGRVRPNARRGKKSAQHLSIHHALGTKARARCLRLAHKSKGAASVGGIACGECWESVIRADERDHQHEISHQQGRCVLCGHRLQTAGTESATPAVDEERAS